MSSSEKLEVRVFQSSYSPVEFVFMLNLFSINQEGRRPPKHPHQGAEEEQHQ